MDKVKIRAQFEAQLVADLGMLTQSAMAAKDAATHSESKAEDQYDTRGLEASYLAGAQAKRVVELEAFLAQLRNLDFRSFRPETPITSTALVELEAQDKTLYCFLLPEGGGRSTVYEGKTVQITTPQSPLGEVLLGRKQGDEIEVRTQVVRDYLIARVW
jgi:hypothetical protein